ncbi:MAG: hypothetical protein E6700_07625 [Winkia neuii]|uniref:hypothetical protein n=1 Tax=Winkia neuii TaxID=33007 RepID=UPI0007939410|nr:hypothetical protein [Winkia neuii]KWZ72949.1 hypothetical protein HMPREF3198_01303 [Winkia neuii]MDK8100208.1 hypothetical protein [Winkia neuii]MDU3135424.1 hypothetical protein [Winkia neuii]
MTGPPPDQAAIQLFTVAELRGKKKQCAHFHDAAWNSASATRPAIVYRTTIVHVKVCAVVGLGCGPYDVSYAVAK